MKFRIALLAFALAGCTPDDNDQSALDRSVVEPDRAGARVDPAAVGTPAVEQAAREGRCDDLQGQAMRDCLERAQYVPRNAQGLPGEPATRRQDPEQVAPDPADRPPHVDDTEKLGDDAGTGDAPRPATTPTREDDGNE